MRTFGSSMPRLLSSSRNCFMLIDPVSSTATASAGVTTPASTGKSASGSPPRVRLEGRDLEPALGVSAFDDNDVGLPFSVVVLLFGAAIGLAELLHTSTAAAGVKSRVTVEGPVHVSDIASGDCWLDRPSSAASARKCVRRLRSMVSCRLTNALRYL